MKKWERRREKCCEKISERGKIYKRSLPFFLFCVFFVSVRKIGGCPNRRRRMKTFATGKKVILRCNGSSKRRGNCHIFWHCNKGKKSQACQKGGGEKEKVINGLSKETKDGDIYCGKVEKWWFYRGKKKEKGLKAEGEPAIRC